MPVVKQSALVGVSMGNTVFCSLIKFGMTLPVGTETGSGSSALSVRVTVTGGWQNSQVEPWRAALQWYIYFLCHFSGIQLLLWQADQHLCHRWKEKPFFCLFEFISQSRLMSAVILISFPLSVSVRVCSWWMRQRGESHLMSRTDVCI